MKNKKTAIVLMNLGGPKNLDEVKSFLFNLFYDKAIIRLPNPFRWLIAKIISSRREETAKEIYSKIGGKSPILEKTIEQAQCLEKELNSDKNKKFKVFISMRYTSPRSSEIISEISKYDPNEVILLPLYPQFSTTTTGSSINDIMEQLDKVKLREKTKAICCYHANEKFIESHVKKINLALDKMTNKNFRILFSAHGLPEKIIKGGDPYQWQIEQTVSNIISHLNLKDLDYKITYQSRVGPMKWLEPYTEKEIEEACKENKTIIIVPIAFVSEHSETLVELDLEYAEIAHKYNIEYIRVETLGVCEIFISGLADIVKNFIEQQNLIVSSEKRTKICPEKFKDCICRKSV